MTFGHQFVWCLSNMNTPISCFISLFYWLVLFDPAKDSLSYWNLFSHLFNSLINLLDLCVSAQPWRWQHFYLPTSMGFM